LPILARVYRNVFMDQARCIPSV